jgi:hypothetical protein
MPVNPIGAANAAGAASAVSTAYEGPAARQIQVLQKQLQTLNKRYAEVVQNANGSDPVAEQEVLFDMNRQIQAMEREIETLKHSAARTPSKEPVLSSGAAAPSSPAGNDLTGKLGSRVDTKA